MEGPTRRRLSTDARREQLLSIGAQLLAQRPYEEVSIEEIARTAGVSKGLLYHYFPTKKDFLLAALERGDEELAGLVAPDPELAPTEQLPAILDRFLDFVERHEAAYASIFRSRGGGDPEIQVVLDANRQRRIDAVIGSLGSWDTGPIAFRRTPTLEAAVQGWFFFIEGAVLRWIEQREVERDTLRDLLGAALLGSLQAAAAVDAAAAGDDAD